MIGFFGHNLEELPPPDTSAQHQDPRLRRTGSVPVAGASAGCFSGY